MHRLAFVSTGFLAVSVLAPLWSFVSAADISDSYQFDPRDGWQAINVTNLQYKYSGAPTAEAGETREVSTKGALRKHGKRSSKKSKKSSTSDKSVSKAASGLLGSVKSAIDSIKAIGNSEPVTITWYTGKDLLNPSCWSSSSWSPSDQSLACAVTLEGWTDRPKCFKFLELCNSPKKCVFVRVVDSCAGCAPGSKHVDLTKAAFTQLADLNEGTLTVQMRQATDPDVWLEDLWGPQGNEQL